MNTYWPDDWTEGDSFLQLVKSDVVIVRLSSPIWWVIKTLLYWEYFRSFSRCCVWSLNRSECSPFHQFPVRGITSKMRTRAREKIGISMLIHSPEKLVKQISTLGPILYSEQHSEWTDRWSNYHHIANCPRMLHYRRIQVTPAHHKIT